MVVRCNVIASGVIDMGVQARCNGISDGGGSVKRKGKRETLQDVLLQTFWGFRNNLGWDGECAEHFTPFKLSNTELPSVYLI